MYSDRVSITQSCVASLHHGSATINMTLASINITPATVTHRMQLAAKLRYTAYCYDDTIGQFIYCLYYVLV